MFTGIIQAVGTIASLSQQGDAVRMTVRAGTLGLDDVVLGDSIACSGACLTVVKFGGEVFEVDVSPETLARTTLGRLAAGSPINLEKALRLSDRLGGHLVSGHVDGVGEVLWRREHDNSVQFRLRAPAGLARYIAPKGSICVEGVSLTVNAVAGAEFELLIIPHTLKATTLGALKAGAPVNLEIDLVARYLERLLTADGAAPAGNLNLELLRNAGFAGH
jgi:riboflavin synthase